MGTKNKKKDNRLLKNSPDQEQTIETMVLKRVVDTLMEEIVELNAVRVFAGYAWARNRDFNTVYDEAAFEEDRIYGENLFKKIYKEKTPSLEELIREMINRQAEVIWWRRVVNGTDPGYSQYLYERDRWEAKRYIAYLFFEELRENCVHRGICPDFGLSLKGQAVIDLLKSLTVEEYCKIKGYLAFLNRKQNAGRAAYGLEHNDYMLAMKDLDSSFLNCNCHVKKQFTADAQKIVIVKDCEKIKAAKYNTRDRLGHIDPSVVEDFVDRYCAFIQDIFSRNVQRKDAVDLLAALYHNSNSKIINMVEFILKCLIASYVDEKIHSKIRLGFYKSDLAQVDKIRYRDQQIKPLF